MRRVFGPIVLVFLIAFIGVIIDRSITADSRAATAKATAIIDQDIGLDRKIAEIDWKNITLDEAVQRLNGEEGLNITIDWPTLLQAGLEKTRKIDLRLRDVSPREILDAALFLASVNLSKPLEWEVIGPTVLVTTTDAMALHTSVRVYDVSDILASIRAHPAYYRLNFLSFDPPPTFHLTKTLPLKPPLSGTTRAKAGDVILYILTWNCTRDQWAYNGGTIAAAWIVGNYLIVCHNPAGHRLVAQLLDSLRQTAP